MTLHVVVPQEWWEGPTWRFCGRSRSCGSSLSRFPSAGNSGSSAADSDRDCLLLLGFGWWVFLFSFITLGLEMSDTKVLEP
jgi:hypothetical protein